MRQGQTISAHMSAVGFDIEDQELEDAAKEIGPMCDKEGKHSFDWYYDLGTATLEHFRRVQQDREQRGCSLYGQRFFEVLEQVLGRPDVSAALLSECATLVRNIGREEYVELSRHPEISPTHVRILGRLSEQKDRAMFKAKIIAEKLTTNQLNAAIVGYYGPRRNAGGGRKPMVAKNVQAALTHLTHQAEKHCSLNANWFGDRFDIRSEIAELPNDRVDQKLKDQVEVALDHCRKLKEMAIADEERLSAILSEVEQRIAAQSVVNARVAEEEKEFEDDEQATCAAPVARPARVSNPSMNQQDRRIGRELHRL